MDIKIFINEDGTMNITDFLTVDSNEKILNNLIYYLSIGIGEDPLNPDLGLPYNLLFNDPSKATIAIQQFAELFNKKFNTNVQLSSINFDKETGVMNIIVRFNNEVKKISINKGLFRETK